MLRSEPTSAHTLLGVWIVLGILMGGGALLNLEAMTIDGLANDYTAERWRPVLPLSPFWELVAQAAIGFLMAVTAGLGRRGSIRARICLRVVSGAFLGLLTVLAYRVFVVWLPSLDRAQAFYELRLAVAVALFLSAYVFLVVSIVVFRTNEMGRERGAGKGGRPGKGVRSHL